MSELDDLVALIEEVSGNVVPPRDLRRLEMIADERLRATDQPSVTAYLRLLRSDRDGAEWRELLSSITVNESYLFRGPQQIRALRDQVLPELTKGRPDRRLRLWSAGCARGEEAVTLALVLADSRELECRDWSIFASDVDEASLSVARRGFFGARAVQHVPPAVLEHHFHRTDDGYRLAERILERIEWRALNLVELPLAVSDRAFDVVFLRNVLIYFRPEIQQRVARAVAATLADDGYLFVGPSETLWQLGSTLIAHDFGDCFCYRQRPPAADVPTRARAPVPEQRLPRPRSVGTGRPPILDPVEGILSHVRGGRLDAARDRAREMAVRAPQEPVLRGVAARVLEMAGEPEEAVDGYRAALYLEPTLHQLRYLLADCLHGLGRTQRARRELCAVVHALRSGVAVSVPSLVELGAPASDRLDAACRELLESLTER